MDPNLSSAAFLAFVTAIAVYVGRVWFKRWFNPLSLYSAIWGFCLFNYELRLIQYYPISMIAWFYIAVAWLALYLGAAAVFFMTLRPKQPSTVQLPINLVTLKRAILILSMIGGVGVIAQVISVSREFGGPVQAILLNSSDIYNARTSNEISGLPYVGSFSFAACALAGVYVGKIGKFTFVSLFPVVLVAVQLAFAMGRTGLGIAAVLFFVCAAYTPRDVRIATVRWKRIAGVVTIAAVLVGTFAFVSSYRGLGVDYPGITPALDRISEYVPMAPSLYSNFSGTPVAFSMYLSSPRERSVGFWGMYTFGPIFRFLSKLGFPTSIPPYEEDYWTPFPVNTSTYLKNVHSDFGPAGILIFPFILGAAATALNLRTRTKPRLLHLVLLANLYVLVIFSFSYNFMLSGDWYIGTVASVVAALVIEQAGALSQNRQIPQVVRLSERG